MRACVVHARDCACGRGPKQRRSGADVEPPIPVVTQHVTTADYAVITDMLAGGRAVRQKSSGRRVGLSGLWFSHDGASEYRKAALCRGLVVQRRPCTVRPRQAHDYLGHNDLGPRKGKTPSMEQFDRPFIRCRCPHLGDSVRHALTAVHKFTVRSTRSRIRPTVFFFARPSPLIRNACRTP